MYKKGLENEGNAVGSLEGIRQGRCYVCLSFKNKTSKDR